MVSKPGGLRHSKYSANYESITAGDSELKADRCTLMWRKVGGKILKIWQKG